MHVNWRSAGQVLASITHMVQCLSVVNEDELSAPVMCSAAVAAISGAGGTMQL